MRPGPGGVHILVGLDVTLRSSDLILEERRRNGLHSTTGLQPARSLVPRHVLPLLSPTRPLPSDLQRAGSSRTVWFGFCPQPCTEPPLPRAGASHWLNPLKSLPQAPAPRGCPWPGLSPPSSYQSSVPSWFRPPVP